nr:histidine phosphatase family protein [Hasllibacter sp. MH4015]
MTYPPLFILRHGETEWNLADRMQGWKDSPLTDLGRAQAAAQGRLLARHAPDHYDIRVSPSGRAQMTAEIALGPMVANAVSDDRLKEINVGHWVGRSLGEIRAEFPDIDMSRDRHLWKFDAPGGETLQEMTQRCRAVLDDLTGPTVIVTHGVTSRLLRCLALHLPPTDLGALPGGQGVVHHVEAGRARVLAE